MRRKFLTILSLTTPLLLVILCGLTILLGGVSWWFWGEGANSRLVRIIPLPPLSTPAMSDSSPAIPPGPVPAGEESLAAPLESQAGENPAPDPSASEQIQEIPTFTLPPGSVSSISQEGIATRLVIPKLNLDAPIILAPLENESWKVDHLGTDYVGHLEGTAPPGSNSNIVLAAHITVAKDVYGPFAGLSQLTLGDEVYVYYGDQIFKYIIDDHQVVERTAVEVTYPSQRGEVTLITCTTWSAQEGRYLERVVLKGYLGGS